MLFACVCRMQLPENYERKKERAEWEEADEKAREEAKKAGKDYDRIKARSMTALEADRKDSRKRKKNPDEGFSTYAAAQHRQYTRLTKQLKPDMRAYEKSKQEWGEDDVSADTLAYGQHDAVSKQGLDRMVEDLDKQYVSPCCVFFKKVHVFTRNFGLLILFPNSLSSRY